MRDKWTNRGAFILASIGSAVGLGNAWRFPGLCAKFGGGAFLFAYIICMILLGIPLLMMETAIGRKAKGGAPKSMRLINKKALKKSLFLCPFLPTFLLENLYYI